MHIPIIECNPYHLELFPFWEAILKESGYDPHYYFPLKEFMNKPAGTMGGVSTKVIPRNKLHPLSKLTDDMKGPFFIINSFVWSTAKEWPDFQKLTATLAKQFPSVLAVFHGRHPNVLLRNDVKAIMKPFHHFEPIFLHPQLRTLQTSPKLSICVPVYPIPTPQSYIPTPFTPIRIGVIGMLWSFCRDYEMLMDTVRRTAHLPIEYYIVGGQPPPHHPNLYRELKQQAIREGTIHRMHFYLNTGAKRFHRTLSNLHFIAPLTKAKEYGTYVLSGSIPLAISLGIPLILSSYIAQAYRISGQYTYTHHLVEIIHQIASLTPQQHNRLRGNIRMTYEKMAGDNRDTLKINSLIES